MHLFTKAVRGLPRLPRTRSLIAAAAVALAPVAAHAQSEGAQQQPESAWIKVCEKEPTTDRDVCVVTQEIRNQDGAFLASAGVRMYADEDEKMTFILGLPLGMLLEPGIRVQVDEGEQISAKYGICFPTGCFAETEIDTAYVDSLKKGNVLTVLAISGRGQTVPFRMSLLGFTKTFDGDPIDPEVLAETQKRLEAEIQRRAEEARRRLLERQSQEDGAAAPAANPN